MIPFWQSKHDDYHITGHLFFTRFSKPTFSQIALLWRPRIQDRVHMLGGVYLKVEMSYKGVLDGKLGMGSQ